MSCTYNNKYLPIVLYYQSEYNNAVDDEQKTAIKRELKSLFDDGQNVVKRFLEEGEDPVQAMSGGTSSDSKEVKTWRTVDVPSTGIDITNMAQFLGGNSVDANLVINEFTRKVVRATILKVENGKVVLPDVSGMEGDVSRLTFALNEIKTEMIRNILTDSEIIREVKELPTMTYENLHANGFFIPLLKAALAKRGEMTLLQRENLALLANFDALIAENCAFIDIRPKYKGKVLSDDDKYVWKGPTVKHANGWANKEKVDSLDQTSDLAKAILDSLPVYQGNVGGVDTYSDSVYVGVGGFYNAMLTMAQWYREGCPGRKRNDDLKFEEFYKGAEGDISAIIGSYIGFLNSLDFDEKEALYRVVTPLKNELISIKNLLFDKDSEIAKSDLINIFKKMIFSNTNINYVSYGTPVGEEGITKVPLKSVITQPRLYAIQYAISDKIYRARINVPDGKTASSKQTLGKFEIIGVENKNGATTTINSYTIKCGGKTRTKSEDNLDFDDVIDLLREVTGIILPSNFMEIGKNMGMSDKALRDCLYACIDPVIKFGIFKQAWDGEHLFTGCSGANIQDYPTKFKKQFYDSIRPLANVLTRMYGDLSKSTTRGINGQKTLPTHGLQNEGSRLSELIYKIKDNQLQDKNYNNPLAYTILWRREEEKPLYSHAEIRSDIKVGQKVTSIAKCTVKDVIKTAIQYDFIKAYHSGKGTIGFQTATHADKTQQFIHQFNLDVEVVPDKTLKALIDDVVKNPSSIKTDPNAVTMLDVIYNCRSERYKAIRDNLFKDYRGAFGWEITSIDDLLQKIQALGNSPEERLAKIEQKFAAEHIDFIPEIHYSKKGFNLTLYNGIKTYIGGKELSPLFKERIDYQRRSFARSLLKDRVKLDLSSEGGSTTMVKYNGNAVDQLDYDIVMGTGDLTLHPLLEAYFQTNMLLMGETNAIELGEVYAHPSGAKTDGWEEIALLGDDADDDQKRWLYSRKIQDESSRLVAQIKRTVIPGATMHTLVQGLDNGVARKMNIAVMEDVTGWVQNILGKSKGGNKASDGASLSFALHGRLENNSLQDARVGVDRKTIGHGMNSAFGDPQLLKFATFDITNSRRQASWASDVELESLYKKMATHKSFLQALGNTIGIPTSKLIDMYNVWRHAHDEQFIYKQDHNTLKYYKLSIVNGNALAWTEVNKQGEDIRDNNGALKFQTGTSLASNGGVNDWYEVDQLFGGCWAMVLDQEAVSIDADGNMANKSLVFSDANIDMMEIMASQHEYQALKDCYIAMAVNASAIKVGAANVNKKASWYNDGQLNTFVMTTEFYGLQMDAEHHITEDTEVSEMTQMMSAFIENGYSKELVNSLYTDVGECVREALEDCIEALKQPTFEGKREAIARILGEAYIKSMENKDTIGLAQAFIQRATANLKKANLLDGIPISAASINDSFISCVANMINKRGIRRKYAGFAGVQTPGYNMVQYFNASGGTGLYRHFAEEALGHFQQKYPNIDIAAGYDTTLFSPTFHGQIIDVSYISDLKNIDVITPNNENWVYDPSNGEAAVNSLRGRSYAWIMAHGGAINGTDYKKTVFDKDVDPSAIPQVNIEDTISWFTYTDIPGQYVAHSMRIRSFTDLDNFKRACRQKLVAYAYKNTAAPHNLRGRTIILKDSTGHEYNHFDLDSTRAAQYANGVKDLSKLDEEQRQLIANVVDATLAIMPERERQLYEDSDRTKLPVIRKILEKAVQADLRNIKKKRPVVIWGVATTIDKYDNLPGEIVTGRVGAGNFGLAKGIDLNSIKDAESFKAAINYSGSKIDNSKVRCDASALLPNGEQILFKVCERGRYYQDYLDQKDEKGNLIIQDAPTHKYEIINNKIYCGDKVVFTNIPNDVTIEFKQVVTENGMKDIILLSPKGEDSQTANAYAALDKLLSSKLLDLRRYYSLGTNIKWLASHGITGSDKEVREKKERELFETFIQNEAQRRYESFKLAKNYAATRIPAQGMQSFMHVQTVAFTDSEVNELFIPIEKMYDDGSDFDELSTSK